MQSYQGEWTLMTEKNRDDFVNFLALPSPTHVRFLIRLASHLPAPKQTLFIDASDVLCQKWSFFGYTSFERYEHNAQRSRKGAGLRGFEFTTSIEILSGLDERARKVIPLEAQETVDISPIILSITTCSAQKSDELWTVRWIDTAKMMHIDFLLFRKGTHMTCLYRRVYQLEHDREAQRVSLLRSGGKARWSFLSHKC